MSDKTESPRQKPLPFRETAIEDLIAQLAPNQRVIGIDLGDKTIGLALSDVRLGIASALKTLIRKKFSDDAAALLRLVDEFDVGALVIGLPLNMDGSSGPRVQATRAFARNITALRPLPVVFWDERMSTMAAERTLIAADLSRAKRAAVIDATAAAYILQGALDRLRRLGAGP